MNISRLLVSVFILAGLTGCNLPTSGQSAKATVPPVDLTVTAIYQTAVAPPPTETSRPAVATQTATTAGVIPQEASPTPIPTLADSATPLPPSPVPPSPVPPTKKPAVTATIPSARGGVSSVATHMDPAPKIDGDWSEWKKVAREYPAQSVVFGKANWSGEDDLNGSYYVGWDAQYLYLAVKVRDDKYVQLASEENIYKGDSIELLLDTNVQGDYYAQKLNEDDFQIGIAVGNPTIADANPEAYLWFPSGKKGILPNVKIGALDEGTVYRVEAAIPWTVFGITPKSGMHLGFTISVNDNDKAGALLQQSMVSSSPGRELADPTTWGDMVLK